MGESESTSGGAIKSGLTTISLLALLYSVFVFLPATAWLQLTMGAGLGVSWITLIIFVEVSRLAGKPVNKQEATIIFLLSGSAIGASFFITRIWRAYYAQSPVAVLFNLTGKIPSWWASISLEAWRMRTFFHPSWAIPIFIALVMFILDMVVDITMGLVTREIYIKSMKLPFPIQQVSAMGITAVVEPTEERRNVFLVGVLVAMIYGFCLYAPPTMSQILTGVPGSAPIPWADLNNIVQVALPGASFGIATSLLALLPGLILPLSTVMSIFIGSVIIALIANPLLIKFHLTPFATEYFHGMNIAQILYRANLYAWAGPMVGVAIGAAIIPLIQNRRALIDGLKSLARVETTGQRLTLTSLPVLLALWLGASVSSVAVVMLLIPDAGIPYLLVMLGFSAGWALIWTMVDAYSIGVTGLSLQPPGQVLPIFKYSYISLGLYKGVDIWFIDPVVSVGGAGWCSTFKVCELNETDPMSYIKGYLIILPLSMILGLLYVQNFWSTAPIPSILYQYTAINWPIQATNTSLWITGKMFYAFDPAWIIGAFGLTLAGGAIISLLKIPGSIIGIAAGVNTAIPFAVTALIGAIVSKFIAWRLSEEWWSRNRRILSAGLALGESTIVVIVSVIGMLSRSLWVLPY